MERLRVREIDDDEGRRLVRVVRRGSGSVVTWRRAQMVLLSAQGMDVAAIAKVAFTSEDRVRDVIHNFNADGFSSLYPKYKGGRPLKFIRDNFSPHLSTAKDGRVGTWASANNAEIARTPSNVSWLNRVPAVHGPSVLRAGRHRPRQPDRASQHDPLVHHLAQ